MKALKIVMTAFGVCVLALVVGYVLLVKYGGVTTDFACKGVLDRFQQRTPATLYLRYEKARWSGWLGGDARGTMEVEWPGKIFAFYDDVTESSLSIVIGSRHPKPEWLGFYSKMSKQITLTGIEQSFDGTCSSN